MSDCVSLFLLKSDRAGEDRAEPKCTRAYMYIVYAKPEIFGDERHLPTTADAGTRIARLLRRASLVYTNVPIIPDCPGKRASCLPTNTITLQTRTRTIR